LLFTIAFMRTMGRIAERAGKLLVKKSVDHRGQEKLIGGSRADARSVSDQEMARQGPDYMGGKAYDRSPVIAEAQLSLLERGRCGGTHRET